MEDEKSSDNTSVGMILGLNRLAYTMEPDLSVATQRMDVTQFFQGSNFSAGSTASCIWNTGSSFCDPRECFIALDVRNDNYTVVNGVVTPTTAGSCWFGPDNSVANVINRLTISSRSGVILEMVNNANVLARIRSQYELPLTSAPAMTMAGAQGTSNETYWPGGTTHRFLLPLSAISPWFGSLNTLLPSALCSGLKFELLLESAQNALVGINHVVGAVVTNAIAPNYSVVGAKFIVGCYQLSDVVLRNLNQQASTNGLEILGTTYFSQSGSRSSSVLSLDVSKSVSRALSAIYVERNSLSPTVFTNSNMESSYITPTDFIRELQFRCGSLYFPQASIRGESANISTPECYLQTLQAFGDPLKIGTMVTQGEFVQGSAVFSCNLERSNVLELSGIPLSNSRMLSLNMSFSNEGTTLRKFNIFLKHAVLVRVFTNSISVEI